MHTARDTYIVEGPADETLRNTAGDPSRLETIHELVRSGDYHVSASAIADRMIERLIVNKRSGEG